MVERRPPPLRFFCHRCNIEFEHHLQDYICPYCAGGFIEQLEHEGDSSGVSGDDTSEADMTSLDDSDEMQQDVNHPIENDFAFLMSGGWRRGMLGGAESLLQHFVWGLGGGAGGGAGTAGGAPFVLVGAPGDYVLGREGLDAVVTQLLGQLEGSGPPPLPQERIAAIPNVPVSKDQVTANLQCSVCWELFKEGESVRQLQCEHVYHPGCIEPWLALHATCPICRRSLLPAEPGTPPLSAAAEPAGGATEQSVSAGGQVQGTQATPAQAQAQAQVTPPAQTLSSLLLRARARRAGPSSNESPAATVIVGNFWGSPPTQLTPSTSSTETDASQYNMDFDFD